ncbi:MAG: MBOAT family O-acyltransferase, partial [Candidatus Izemoplasmatales bacterium]|nr:MBOAT family O-acyltransferase [Candidatus Izemoplasmatales bacterium]
MIIIVCSWSFYAYTNIFNLVNLLIVTSITLLFARKIRKVANKGLYLAVGVLIVVIQLVLAKYSSVLAYFTSVIPYFDNSYFNLFILPIGISFYSLQAIGFMSDVRSGRYIGDIRLRSISAFLSFFPQSVSGPIHRASELIPQFELEKEFIANNIVIGCKTMLWGFFCKLMVADKISIIIAPIFNTVSEQEGLSLLLATLLYSLQIYFDFWGYSLIAIGVGRVLGFTINVNFNAPYSANSFKDFWHKWHITLSKWMRDYVYIPLGGRKQKSFYLFCGSILITFLVSGFWHGVTINFILWGATHAFLYLLEDYIRRHFSQSLHISKPVVIVRLIRFFKTISFFIIISFTWLIFRTDSYSELIGIVNRIVFPSGWSLSNVFMQYMSTTNSIYLIIILSTHLISQSNFIKKKTEQIASTPFENVTDFMFISTCLILI